MTTAGRRGLAEASRALFEQALDSGASERERLLSGAPAEVAREAAELLEAHTSSAGFLEQAPAARRFGPWQVLGSIGSGGMGDVSLVRRTDGFLQFGALKRVRRDLVTPDIVARFKVERAALARLEHPNIARLIDGGETPDGEPYLVMEFVDGERIDEWCDARRVGVEARLRLALPVLDALGSAHARLVIHRDLKPTNVLVSAEGAPKLLDFGIARLLDPEGSSAPTMPALTPRYASPEQLRAESATTATDVYGAGVLLYELLTGTHPHGDGATSPADMQEAILHRAPPKASDAVRDHRTGAEVAAARGTTPARLASALRGDLDTVLAMALRKEPERRYATVTAFADDIRRHLDGRPVTARGDSNAYRLSRFVRRNRLASAAIVALAVGAVATTALSVRAMQAESLARAETETQLRTSQAVIDFLTKDIVGPADPAGGGASRTMLDVLDEAARSLPVRLAGQPRALATVESIVGQAYRRLGRHDEARSHLTASLALDGDLESRLAARRELAILDADLGERARAEDALRAVAADAEASFGPSHPTTVGALNALGEVLFDLGRYDDALALLSEALARAQRLTPEPTDDVRAIRGNIARTLHAAGRYAEAETASRAHLADVEAAFGPRHAEVVHSRSNLGLLLADAGRPTEARPLLEEALAGAVDIYGPEAPATLVIKSNLVLLAFNVSDFESAGRLGEEIHAARRRMLGDEHPDTLLSLNLLGLVALNTGQPEAIGLLTTVLDARRRTLGERHPQTINSGHNLGAAQSMTGRYDEAVTTLEGVLQLRMEEQGPDHPSTLVTMLHLGRAHDRLGHRERASRLYLDGRDRARQALGADAELTRKFDEQLASLGDAAVD